MPTRPKLGTGRKNPKKKIDASDVLSAQEEAGHAGDERVPTVTKKKAASKRESSKSAAKVKATPKSQTKSKPVKEDADVVFRQLGFRVPEKTHDAVVALRDSQEPAWPQPYLMKRMYLALCAELGVEPEDI